MNNIFLERFLAVLVDQLLLCAFYSLFPNRIIYCTSILPATLLGVQNVLNLFSFHVFLDFVVRWTYSISDVSIFVMGWPFCHYKISFYVSSSNFVLMYILFDINVFPPVFFWLLFEYTYYFIFLFSIFHVFQY